MIFNFLFLLIQLVLTTSPSDAIIKGKEVEELEKQSKALACSFLLEKYINIQFIDETKIIEILKKNKLIKKDSELTEKIPKFLLALCYSKLNPDTANEILLSLTEGKDNISQNDKYNYLFDFGSKTDFKNFKNIMNEMNKILKDIEKEEKSLHEQRKDDKNLDKQLKDLEKKLVKNKKYDKNKKVQNEEILDNNKKRKIKKMERKEREKREKEIKEKEKKEKKPNEEINQEDDIYQKKRGFSFQSFFEKIELANIWPFIISLIIILIFPVIYLQTNIFKENNIKVKKKDLKEKDKENLNKENEDENKKAKLIKKNKGE